MSEVQSVRHCAFCLESLSPSDGIVTCDKCHRRPYCSEECRALDWDGSYTEELFPGLVCVIHSMDVSGQHHKQWCGLGVLEEDVDWEVVPVEGKGLGIVAKTLIPPMSRIVVDGPVPRKTGSKGRSQLFNHACDSNAARLVEDDKADKDEAERKPEEEGRWPGAFTVFSKRVIQPGEEICVSYTQLNDSPWMLSNDKHNIELNTTSNCRRVLELEHGFKCPANCFCRKKGLDKAVADWKANNSCINCVSCKEDCLEAETKEGAVFELDRLMKKVEVALQGNEELKGNQMTKAILLEKGFAVAARSRLTLDKGLEYLKEAVAIRKTVGHPKFGKLEKAEAYLKDPSSYEEYLYLDKKWGKLDRATLCQKKLKRHLQKKRHQQMWNRRGLEN